MLAQREVILPGSREPVVDKEGRMNPTWMRFFTDLYERTGGGPEDKVELSAGAAETAQTAAEAADAAAANAQAAADAAQTYAEGLDGGFSNEIEEMRFLRDFGDDR